MKARVCLSGVLTLLCTATVIALFIQRQTLSALQGEQQRLLTQLTLTCPDPPAAMQTSKPVPTVSAPPLEVLQLRNQVHQLLERQGELTGAREENERLRPLVANSLTNKP